MLNVPGVDPKRIECVVDKDGTRRVVLDGVLIAWLVDHGPGFDGNWRGDDLRRDAQAAMLAAFDEWRASGGTRLWPEPTPEPVDCVCGGKACVYGKKGPVECDGPDCLLRANNVPEWNAIQAALKKMKEATR